MFGKIAAALAGFAISFSGAAQASTVLDLQSDGAGGYYSRGIYYPATGGGDALAFFANFAGLTLTDASVSLNGEVFYRLWDPVAGNDLPYAANSYDLAANCSLASGCIVVTGSELTGSMPIPAEINATCGPGTPLFTTCSQYLRSSYVVADFYFKADGSGITPSATLDFTVRQNPPVSAVPEPATWAMLIAGFSAVGLIARRTRRTGPARPAQWR